MSRALLEKHVRALELRKMGWSYSQIKSELDIAKSTASAWLRQYPLSYEQLDKLQFHSERRIEHFRATMAKKKKALFDSALADQKLVISGLSERELYLCGLTLYWGEGGKTLYSEITFTNTDPRMIKFILIWLQRCIYYPLERIRIHLHLYKDMDIEAEIRYWIQVTNLDREQFTKPYI